MTKFEPKFSKSGSYNEGLYVLYYMDTAKRIYCVGIWSGIHNPVTYFTHEHGGKYKILSKKKKTNHAKIIKHFGLADEIKSLTKGAER